MEFKGTKSELIVIDRTKLTEQNGTIGSFDIETKDGKKFAQVHPYEFYGIPLEQSSANALLISKAPEMLEMLQSVQETISYAINATPSGQLRNKLSEKNILILALIKSATEL